MTENETENETENSAEYRFEYDPWNGTVRIYTDTEYMGIALPSRDATRWDLYTNTGAYRGAHVTGTWLWEYEKIKTALTVALNGENR